MINPNDYDRSLKRMAWAGIAILASTLCAVAALAYWLGSTN